MGMFEFRVSPDDAEPYRVEATARDVLKWEKTNKAKRAFSDVLAHTSLIDMYGLAYVAAVRQGLYTGDLKTFEETCDVTGAASEEEDPTPPAP